MAPPRLLQARRERSKLGWGENSAIPFRMGRIAEGPVSFAWSDSFEPPDVMGSAQVMRVGRQNLQGLRESVGEARMAPLERFKEAIKVGRGVDGKRRRHAL